jgi:hypothetical protein
MSNEIIRGNLLSGDGMLTLMVLALDPGGVESAGLSRVIGDIQSTVDADLAGPGLTAQLTGAPIMQLEIRNAIERDREVLPPARRRTPGLAPAPAGKNPTTGTGVIRRRVPCRLLSR